MKVNVKKNRKWNLCHKTENFRFYIGDSPPPLKNFSYQATYIYANLDTHFHTHIVGDVCYGSRQNL